MSLTVKRLLAALIDFMISCYIASFLVLIVTKGEMNITAFSLSVFFGSVFIWILFKDFAFKDASVGKRILKIKVVKEDGTRFSIVDVIKRSLPFIIYPLEIILLLAKGTRIGDMWAGTAVVYTHPHTVAEARTGKDKLVRLRRLLAGCIDGWVSCVMACLSVVLVTVGEMDVNIASIWAFGIVLVLSFVFKDMVFKNASIGKKIFTLKVEKKDGTKLSVKDAITRALPLILCPLEIILILAKETRLGDMWAGTMVVPK